MDKCERKLIEHRRRKADDDAVGYDFRLGVKLTVARARVCMSESGPVKTVVYTHTSVDDRWRVSFPSRLISTHRSRISRISVIIIYRK